MDADNRNDETSKRMKRIFLGITWADEQAVNKTDKGSNRHYRYKMTRANMEIAVPLNQKNRQ